jgi:hypothetical protein
VPPARYDKHNAMNGGSAMRKLYRVLIQSYDGTITDTERVMYRHAVQSGLGRCGGFDVDETAETITVDYPDAMTLGLTAAPTLVAA